MTIMDYEYEIDKCNLPWASESQEMISMIATIHKLPVDIFVRRLPIVASKCIGPEMDENTDVNKVEISQYRTRVEAKKINTS